MDLGSSQSLKGRLEHSLPETTSLHRELISPQVASVLVFYIIGEGVLVQEPARDVSELVHLGCYGKGVFSRCIPTHDCLPQLTELTRPSKRRSQTASAAARVSPSAVECTSEWVEKLKHFEEAELK